MLLSRNNLIRRFSSKGLSANSPTTKLVLLRHGESTWNKLNLFTGWADVPLSEKGEKEAAQAGKLMKAEGLEFDIVYVSVLQRAIKTLWLAMEAMDRQYLPVIKTWRLNERHYGALQGLNKAETAEKFGEAKVMEWRRSYAIPPPPVDPKSEHHPQNDPRYRNVSRSDLPATESLATTGQRFMPEWKGVIAPRLAAGENVLITAHGNSLRALVKHLDDISEKDILAVNIPTGVPLVYEIDRKTLKPVKKTGSVAPLQGKYLGDAAAIAAAAAAVANQAKGGKKH
jgi:2,3-bisphosphoglycerate-dependent phosphoglycerate mutase